MLILPHEVRKNFFHLHFSVVWIDSHSTFVLCTALLTVEYTEGDRGSVGRSTVSSSFIGVTCATRG